MPDLCITATQDHNVYASFHPSIVTKDAETRGKINSAMAILVARYCQKTSQLQSGQGFGMQRTHKNVYI